MKRHLRTRGSVLILVLIVAGTALSFSPPSAVPYTGAAYADRAKLVNATGMTPLAAYESPGSCPLKVNLFSQNVSYSLPILSLPGRAGLGLNLTLAYNSKVWVKSGSTVYFDGDKGWPAPGWRLGFGRIDGKYTISSVDHYFLISGDGGVRDLKYNSTSGLYESYDSSYIDFDESTGILRYKDGTQVTYAAQSSGYVMPTQIKDRNGNYLTISYTGTGQQISSIVDTLGRTTSFSYDGSGYLSTITKSGFNNASRTWTFAYDETQLSYSFNSLTVNGPSSGSNVLTLTSVTFPNGTKQVFLYNGYAQLYEVQMKSSSNNVRGKYLTAWQSTPGGGWSDSPTPASVGNNEGTNTNTYSLTFNSYSTTFTNPASTPRTTSFISSGSWDDALPSQTTVGSTVLRTVANVWGHDGNSINPRLTRVTTTLNDSSESSKVEYDYTTHGNVSEVRDYDFGLTLIRKTATSYVTDTNYTNRRILNLPSAVSVYDGSNNRKQYSTFAYDGSSLTSATGASNHDDTNYGTGFAYRGLRTSTTRYADAATPGSSITDSYTYDMLGNMRTESADCCVTKSYSYSSTTQFSQPDSITRGSGTTLTTSSTYDSYTSLLASSTDENNKTTTFAYDVADRRTSTTLTDSTVLSVSYDDAAATASSTSTTPIESGKDLKQKTEVDGLGRTARVTVMDTSSNVISKVDTLYTSTGAVWKTSLPFTGSSASYWTENVYDILDRATKVIPPDGSSSSNHIATSYSGRTTTVTDQTGKQRKSKSDGLGRQIEVTEPDPANSNSLTLVTSYTYDPMGSLTQISQGSQTRTYAFDGLSRKTSETTPEAGTVTFAYNSDSLLTSRTDARGVVTSYTYDSALNRLTQVSYNVSCCSSVPSTSTVSHTYGTSTSNNNNGRLVTLTDGLGEESYTYDSRGRRTQVQKKVYNVTYTTAYTYNLANAVVTMTYPSGRVVKNEYDAIGRVNKVKHNTDSIDYASSITYNAANQLTAMTYGSGVTTSIGYSADRQQMNSLTYTKSGTNLLSLSYGYSQSGNNNGQIASITDNVESGRTTNYTYDSLHRVSTAVTSGSTPYPQWGLSWTYDRYGNRTDQSVTHGSGPSNSVSVSTSTNRITGMGGSTFYYDSNGNLTQDDLYKYKYDAENRVVEIRNLSDTLISSYAFDSHSLRVVKVVGADRTVSIYAGTRIISEFEDAASATYSSGTTPGQAVQWWKNLDLYQHNDHLSARVTTDQQGQVANQQAHHPFGEQWYASGAADPSVERKFTSYMKDDEVSSGKLNYAVFREHSARVARFLRPDPVRGNVRNPQRLNRYSYVGNEPIRRIDPRGLDPAYVDEMPLIEGEGWISPSGTQAINASGPTVRHTGDPVWDWGAGAQPTTGWGDINGDGVDDSGIVMYPGSQWDVGAGGESGEQVGLGFLDPFVNTATSGWVTCLCYSAHPTVTQTQGMGCNYFCACPSGIALLIVPPNLRWYCFFVPCPSMTLWDRPAGPLPGPVFGRVHTGFPVPWCR